MRNILQSAVLAGTAALVGAGVALAMGGDRAMTLVLPDGSQTRIQYSGGMTPVLGVVPISHLPAPAAHPAMTGGIFEALEGPIDGQMDEMLRHVRQLEERARYRAIDGDPVILPPDKSLRYQFVSTSTGDQGCTRSVAITSLGDGQEPKVVSSASGDCRDRRPPQRSHSATPSAAGSNMV